MLVVSHVPAKRPAFMRSAIAAVVTVLTASAAVAAPPADTDRPERPGRYILQPVDGGVLRMDTESGAISLCVKRGTAVACEPVPDERSGQKEVERLATENRELKAKLWSQAIVGRLQLLNQLELPLELLRVGEADEVKTQS